MNEASEKQLTLSMKDKAQIKEASWLQESPIDSDAPISDYQVPHPDILQAKAVEPYHVFFRLFTLRNPESITLCLAVVRTLARETEGVFTREEMERTLSYLSGPARTRAIRAIHDYGWIVTDGIRYEIPERARTLLAFLFGPLTRPDDDLAQEIRVAFAMADLDEASGTDDETAEGNFEAAIGTLRRIRKKLQIVLEQRSPTEARRMLERSRNVREEIMAIERRMRERNRKAYKYSLTTEVLHLCAQIMRLHQELFTFIHQDIQSNARAFGQYLSPEQLEQFLHDASINTLSDLIRRSWASPRVPLVLQQQELVHKGVAYLEHRPEVQGPTLPPPVVEQEQREVVIQRQESPAQELYREVMARLAMKSAVPLPEMVVADSYGKTLFRTGVLITIRRELVDQPEKPGFDVVLDGTMVQLPDGPVSCMSDGAVQVKCPTAEPEEEVAP